VMTVMMISAVVVLFRFVSFGFAWGC